MNKSTQFVVLSAIFLQCSVSIAMEYTNPTNFKPVHVGDYLRTRQSYFSDHVAVVVKSPEGATLDPSHHGSILLAENSEGGVKLVWLKDFIIKENDVSHVSSPYALIYHASKPYLVVARALSALYANIEYDIALKSCGLFADWCVFGNKSEVEDFRDKNSQSLGLIPKYVILPLCKCGAIGQWILTAAATSFDKEFGKKLNQLTPDEIDSIGASEQGYADFVNRLVLDENMPLSTKKSHNIPSLEIVVYEAFLLHESGLILSNASMTKLKKMNEKDALKLCSQIVDSDINNQIADINKLLEQLIL